MEKQDKITENWSRATIILYTCVESNLSVLHLETKQSLQKSVDIPVNGE